MKSGPQRIAWKARELKLLGTAPDSVIARKLGRTKEAVSLRRQKLGIEAPLQPGWTQEDIQLLGTRPDREVARLTGRSLDAVAYKRLDLGIKAWQSTPTKARPPLDPEMTRLRFGPYAPPRTRRGAFLFCEWRGTVKVAGYSDGPIPWPMKWNTRSLILCGDLVRAVRQESELAVALHWDVCPATVTKWRAALDVGPFTEGTRQIKSYATTEAMIPAVRAHIAAAKIGKPRNLSARGRARLLAALRRPKSERWHKSMAPVFEARRGIPVNPKGRAWTAEEERLLGTKPDAEIARLLHRSRGAVTTRRWLKDIAYTNPKLRPWKPAELKLIGKLPEAEIAARTGHPLTSVHDKRRELGLFVRPRIRPWTAREERWLGNRPDAQVARLLGRNPTDVRLRRAALGRPPAHVHPLYEYWTPEEDRLLGTATDSVVAGKVGRSTACVRRRRQRLALPSFRLSKARDARRLTG